MKRSVGAAAAIAMLPHGRVRAADDKVIVGVMGLGVLVKHKCYHCDI